MDEYRYLAIIPEMQLAIEAAGMTDETGIVLICNGQELDVVYMRSGVIYDWRWIAFEQEAVQEILDESNTDESLNIVRVVIDETSSSDREEHCSMNCFQM
ncbi:MAG: hypothetical protein R3C53_19370 [Pirellulaceae bacterium]